MINISILELEPYVSIIRQLNQQMTDVLNSLKTQMLLVENYWEGETSETFRERVQSLNPKIEAYQETVERYASHLALIIEQYRLTEQNLQRNATSF